jgi:hypothetical protein
MCNNNMATARNVFLALGLVAIISKYTAAIRNLKRRCVINLRTYRAQNIVCTSEYSITNMEKTLNFEVMYRKFKLYGIDTYVMNY